MEEVVDIVEDVVVDEVSHFNFFPPLVPSADGTNKVVARRLCLFQQCSSWWEQTLVEPLNEQTIFRHRFPVGSAN